MPRKKKQAQEEFDRIAEEIIGEPDEVRAELPGRKERKRQERKRQEQDSSDDRTVALEVRVVVFDDRSIEIVPKPECDTWMIQGLLGMVVRKLES